jgi:SAM-dependent methyltransferase
MDLRELPEGDFTRYPWEVARCRHFLNLASRYAAADWPRVLDVGAGDGLVASELAGAFGGAAALVCWDLGYTPEVVDALRSRTHGAVQFMAEPPEEEFDLVLLLDVLEHVEKDERFLAKLVQRNLAPGGRVIVSVPAWPRLFGPHDRALGHHRRYTPAAGRRLIEQSGLRLMVSGGLFHSLLTVRFLERILRLDSHFSDVGEAVPLVWRYGEASARAIEWVLRAEAVCSRAVARARLQIPGLSWWAVCEKPA